MPDHNWWLKTFDMNGNGVVKLWCGECQKDCGGGNKDHSKAHIDNLFNNFKGSHIVSTTHVQSFCFISITSKFMYDVKFDARYGSMSKHSYVAL